MATGDKSPVHDLEIGLLIGDAGQEVERSPVMPNIEALLEYSSGTISGVAAIYIRHNFFGEMRKAMLLFEDHLTGIFESHQDG